jgi:hypothetical protein
MNVTTRYNKSIDNLLKNTNTKSDHARERIRCFFGEVEGLVSVGASAQDTNKAKPIQRVPFSQAQLRRRGCVVWEIEWS